MEELASELSALRERATSLIQRADQLKTDGDVAGIGKVKKKIQAELSFIKSLEEGKVIPKKNQLRSTNLSHLDALLHTAESFDHVTAVLRPVHYETHEGDFANLLVDVVGQKDRAWVKVTARKAEALHRIWEGEGEYGEHDIVQQVAQYQDASRQNLLDFSPPAVHVVFYSGITQAVADELLDLGAVVHGHIYEDEEQIKLTKPTLPVFQSIVDQESKVSPLVVNLDVTTMIGLVSDLCQGGSRFSFTEPLIEELSQQERQSPLLPHLQAYLKGKTLVACETAVADFKAILETIAGQREKERAEELLQRLDIVADQPSTRTLRLSPSNRIKDKARVIFGTGDSLKITTTTANEAFVRAASKQGVNYSVFLHQSRALTEKKQLNPAKATPTASPTNQNNSFTTGSPCSIEQLPGLANSSIIQEN